VVGTKACVAASAAGGVQPQASANARSFAQPARRNERDTAESVFGLPNRPTGDAFPAEASGVVSRSSSVTAARQRRICTDFPCIQPPRTRLPKWGYYTAPMTVGEAIAWVGARLQAAGLSEPQREAQALVAACLGWERARLVAHPEARLSALQAHRLERWARRRAQREPLAYLTRRAWFYGLELTVGRGALIPRPETELLVEVFLGWAGSLPPSFRFPPLREVPPARRGNLKEGVSCSPILVDAGTGTGAIALACLMHAPRWLGVGIDRSRRALRIAQANRHALGLQARLMLVQGDWLRGLRTGSVDAVLSNPPYVLPDEWDALPPEVSRYEPRGALLVPAGDPLRPYRRIARGAHRSLRPGGLLAFETSPRLAPLLAEQLPAWGFPSPHIVRDYAGNARVVWAVRG
jgi:release factor glutamine methyltransferase